MQTLSYLPVELSDDSVSDPLAQHGYQQYQQAQQSSPARESSPQTIQTEGKTSTSAQSASAGRDQKRKQSSTTPLSAVSEEFRPEPQSPMRHVSAPSSPTSSVGSEDSILRLSSDETGQLMDVATNLNAAQSLITEPAERLTLARLNLDLALRTRRATAFKHALKHAMYGLLALIPAEEARKLLESSQSVISSTASATQQQPQKQQEPKPSSEKKSDAATTQTASVATQQPEDNLLPSIPPVEFARAIPDSIWKSHHVLAFSLLRVQQELEFVIGNRRSSAEIADSLIAKARSNKPLEEARVLRSLIAQDIATADSKTALQLTLRLLKLLGVQFPIDFVGQGAKMLQVMIVPFLSSTHSVLNLQDIKQLVGSQSAETLSRNLKTAADPATQLIYQVCSGTSFESSLSSVFRP